MDFKAIKLSEEESVATVSLNRPEKANAMNDRMYQELTEVLTLIDEKPSIRSVVLTGEGPNFCSGIDLSMLGQIFNQGHDCLGRRKEAFRKMILRLQESMTALELCSKPVLAMIDGVCIGGGVDLIAACDMRYATQTSRFSIKEVQMGLAADLGSLQRLPSIVGQGKVREWAYLGDDISPDEARESGLLNRVYANRDEMTEAVSLIAKSIAARSPLAVRGTKEILNYSRDHSTQDGLNYVATWNAAMLPSVDLDEIFKAKAEKRMPMFVD